MNAVIKLLQRLIATPSVSRQEAATADILQAYLTDIGLMPKRIGNNVVTVCGAYNSHKPNLLLCSHHDTVAPALGYCRNPYEAVIEEGRLYGLGSNDAGGALVCLVEASRHLQSTNLPYNLFLALCAEEEVSGACGLPLVLQHLPKIDAAIVGEPTGMKAAIGERGLMVLDGEAAGVSGHAARGDGVNAIYMALKDIDTLKHICFDKESSVMGSVHLQTTQIDGGIQHNVVPDRCRFVVDVRTTDVYTNQEVYQILQSKVQSRLTPRSLHHAASVTPAGSPLLEAIARLVIDTYISPTTSDWIHLRCPALKIGPGDSCRSHTADEYILLSELEEGVAGYIRLLEALFN